ncbi:hypothetical protein P608_17615 [Comamonas thiooxydans]|uniref:Uncharacterized protein n=1 Tax=Comamonas thiooxydans TaxID=363952 RepID=A0A0E3CF20_9BURK|nr:hypothetical protein P608_17615 [Comamonas thiooxydans]KGH16339.1 hypothetical protein P607_20420 [Comamonas thiooxydans]KGH20514.1 hypothetical protein P606_21125 [Comamonas thiooxydans]
MLRNGLLTKPKTFSDDFQTACNIRHEYSY